MAFTEDQYRQAGEFILANLNDPNVVATRGQELGLSSADILRAAQTVNPNLTASDVSSYFGNAGLTYKEPTTVAPLTSVAYQYATGEGGIGLDAMNKNIQDFFAASPTEEATRAAMSQYGVSDEDIRRATGKSLADYYPGVLPTSGATSNAGALPTSDTYTEDRYNPNDPASSRYIADPNAGQYVFDPVTGKHTLVSSTGALPTTSFDAFGYQKSGTWTEDRYNPNDPASKYYIADPNAGQYVFDPVTGKHTLVSSTGATSVTGATGNDTVTGATSLTGALSAATDTTSRFYDPTLKQVWAIESASDYGYDSNRFAGSDGKVYIHPTTGQALTRDEYLSTAGTPEALAFQKEQASRITLANQINTLTNNGTSGGTWDKNQGYALHQQNITDYLIDQGISDLSNVTWKRNADNTITLFDKATNKELGTANINSPYIEIGREGTGKGKTHYFMVPTKEGGVTFASQWEPVSDPTLKTIAKAGPIVNIANFLTGGALTPFAMAVNAINAAENRDALGFVTNMAGAAGLNDIAMAGRVAQMAKSGNVLGALTTVVGSEFGNQLGGVDLGGGFTVADAMNAVSAIDLASKGDYAGALTMAGKAAGSADLQTAGSALAFAKAVESGDLNRIASAGMQLKNNLSTSINNSQVANLLINSAGIGAIDADAGTAATGIIRTDPLITAGQESLDAKIYSAVKATGASDAVAAQAVKIATATGRDTQYDPDLTDATRGQALANLISQAQEAIRMGAGEAVGTGEIKAGAGEFTGAGDSRAISEQISNAPNCSAAFAAARNAFGPSSTFNWQGKLYSTATADETKPLITTKAFDNSIQDQDIAARLNMGLDANGVRSLINEWNTADPAKRIELLKTPAFAGIKAIYDEKSVTKQLSPSEIASTVRAGASGSVTPYESNWVLAGKDLAQAIQDTVALVTGEPGNTAAILNRAGGQLLQGVGGATSTLGANVLGGELTRAGQTIEDIGSSTSTYAQTQQGIIKAINDEPNWWNKAIIAGRSALENPGAIADWTAIEVLQEGPALLAFGAAKTGKVAAGLVADGLETMGFAHNDARDAALAAGKSITEANNIGDKAGWLSMASTMATAGVLDARSIKALQDLRVGRITQEAAKEVVGGAFDEGATAAIVQAVSTGKLDPNAIGTAAILGGLIEGTTSTSLSTVGEGAHDKVVIGNQLSTELASGADPTAALSNTVTTSLGTGANPSTVLNGVVTSGLSNNLDPATVVSSTLNSALSNNISTDTALTTVVGSAINNNVSASTVVTSAIDATLGNNNVNSLAAATTTNNAAIASSLGNTGSTTAAVTNVVTGTLNSNLATSLGANGATTLAVSTGLSSAIDNSVNPSTAISSTVSAAISNGSNASTAVATAVATALASGVDTTTAVNSALSTNNNTGLTVDINATNNTNTAVVTDTNNNTVTSVTNNNNSGITTSVVTNNNTGSTVTTSINNNSGVVTTTTVDGSVQTQVVVDTTNNTTTTVATDINTGQIINIDTVVGGTGNDVIVSQPPVITEPEPPVITEPEPPVIIEPEPPVITEPEPPVITEPPVVTQPPQVKTATPTPKTGGALPSLLMGGGSGGGALPGNLSPSMLEGAPIEALMNLPQLVQLYPQLANVDQRLLQMLSGRAGIASPTGSGEAGNLPTALSMTQAGAEPSPGMPVKAAKAATTNQDTKLLGGAGPLSGKLDALSAAGLTALNTGLGYAKGGLSHASGHNPEFITGATGYYVKGRGDGQSDDIPAMLADGEYVFDADTVAALGNGSSDAGAKILDKMRENIRKHKRSAHHSKIPPKAKSPLEYLKG